MFYALLTFALGQHYYCNFQRKKVLQNLVEIFRFAYLTKQNKRNMYKPNKVITLGQFIIERQTDFPYAKGELSRLLRDIGIATKIVNREAAHSSNNSGTSGCSLKP